MKRRYATLGVAIIAVSIALTMLGRPGGDGAPRQAPTAAPVVELTVAIVAGKLSPAVTSVPKDHRVRLRIEHRGTTTARIALAGYEDLLDIPPLPPGTTWTAEFLADRPGEDFAWLLDGEPAGRLVVTGSHLIEGHR